MREPQDDWIAMEFRNERCRAPWRRANSHVRWILLSVFSALVLVAIVRGVSVPGAWSAAPTTIPESIASGGVDSFAADPAEIPRQRYESSAGLRSGMVYRCVAGNGAVSLQSHACGPDQRTTKAMHAPPEWEPPRRATARSPSRRAASSAQYAIVRATPASDGRRARCDQARRSRDEALDRAGLSRTYDLLQRLDEMVRSACGE